MLASAGLGDDPLFAHAPRHHDLAEHVVDLVRAGVVELLTLEIDFRAAEMLGEALGQVQRHQRFRDKAPAENAEMPALVGTTAEGIWQISIHRTINSCSCGALPLLPRPALAGEGLG